MSMTVNDDRLASLMTKSNDEIEANNDESSTDPPASLMTEDFNRYIAVDSDIHRAAKITDEELCAGLQALVPQLPTRITNRTLRAH